jgi:hypothetical protein
MMGSIRVPVPSGTCIRYERCRRRRKMENSQTSLRRQPVRVEPVVISYNYPLRFSYIAFIIRVLDFTVAIATKNT